MECYYPNGQSGDGLHPCNGTAEVSHCCRDGDVCVSNGFCFSAGLNALVRRGCTDSSWNSTECPQQCTIGEDLRSADVILTPCDLYTTFCCGQDQAARNCCDTSNGTVRIPAGSAILPTSTVTVSDTRSTSSPTDCPSTTMSTAPTINCQPQQKAIIGVGAALGSATLLAVLLSGWFYDQRRKADRRSRLAEQRYQDLVRQRATFE